MSRKPQNLSRLAALGFFAASGSLFAASLAYGQETAATPGAGGASGEVTTLEALVTSASSNGQESAPESTQESGGETPPGLNDGGSSQAPAQTDPSEVTGQAAGQVAPETEAEAAPDADNAQTDQTAAPAAGSSATTAPSAPASDAGSNRAADSGPDAGTTINETAETQSADAESETVAETAAENEGEPEIDTVGQNGGDTTQAAAVTAAEGSQENASEEASSMAVDTSAIPARNPARPIRTLTPSTAPQTDRIRAAGQEWQARETTTYLGEAGRVTVVYGQAQPALVCRAAMICTVELELGEEPQDSVVVSDPINWSAQLYQRITPEGGAQFFISVTPTEFAQDASMLVITDRRVYTIDLVSDPILRTPLLSFAYPDTRAREAQERTEALRARAQAARANAAAARTEAVAARGVSTASGPVPAEELDFAFRIAGRERFTPTRVYTDGRQTYVDLPQSYRGEIPIPIATGQVANGVFNYSVEDIADGRRMVLDNVIHNFDLQVGRDVVRIRKVN